MPRQSSFSRVQRFVLRLAVSSEDAEALEGDLRSEVARQQCAGRTPRQVNRWIRREVASACLHAWGETLRRAFARVPSAADVLRFSTRSLTRHPGSTLALVAALALGIGANTVGFSVVHAVLVRPLPVTDETSVIVIREVLDAAPAERGGVSYLNVQDWRAATQTLSSIALISPDQARLEYGEANTQIEGLVVSSGFFTALGITPAAGRSLDEFADHAQMPDGATPIMLTHRGWRRYFGAAPTAVGTVVRLDGQPARVVGITADRLFPLQEDPIDYWIGTAAFGSPSDSTSANGSRNFRGYAAAVGRLNPDASVEDARLDLERIQSRLAIETPAAFQGRTVRVESLRATLARGSESVVWFVYALVTLVWLIACANVTNIQLARTAGRAQEISVRRALGASQARIVGQLLAENVMIALAGGLAGFVLARGLVALLMPLLPKAIPAVSGLAPGGSAFVATVAMSLVTGLVCGLLPSWAALRHRRDVLTVTTGRQHTDLVPRSLRQALLAGQVALAMVLLVIGALLGNSLYRLTITPAGFTAQDVWTTRVVLNGPAYADASKVNQVMEAIRQAAEGIPGVQTAALSQSLPFTGLDNSTRLRIAADTSGSEPSAGLRFVSPQYFDALGIPLNAGRALSASDTGNAPPVLIVNETFANTHFGSALGALGRSVSLGWGGSAAKTIVGTVGDVRHRSLADAPTPEMYVPVAQFSNTSLSLVLRMAPGAIPAAPDVHRVLRSIDDTVPSLPVRALTEYRSDTLATPRFGAVLLGGFAVLALVLASVGVYGVVSYLTAMRTREIGVRIALGADDRAVLALVLAQTLWPVVLGVCAGLGVTMLVTGLVREWLFGVTPTDPLTLMAVVGVVLIVAGGASLIPARRALRVNPVSALRGE